MDKLYVLTVGYPPIDPKSDEKSLCAPLEDDGLGNLILREPINFFDYHVIMIRNTIHLISFPESFNDIGEYEGILALSFYPISVYPYYKLRGILTVERKVKMEKFNILSENFYIHHYSKVLGSYLDSKLMKGLTLILIKNIGWVRFLVSIMNVSNIVGAFLPIRIFHDQ
ncbi:MAG: hypothetical protein QW779_04980 [Nitrososphaerales archaeon]